MKTTTLIVFSLALSLLQCFTSVSSKGVPGYVFSNELGASEKVLKQSIGNSAIYNDNDVKNLVLNNLGLLQQNQLLSENTQSLISQFGNRNLLSQGKLNYVFLLEGAPSKTERKSLENSEHKHQAALFNICSGDDSNQCILNQLFNTADQTSVASSLASFVQNGKSEAFIYSTDAQAASDFPQSTLATVLDKKGNVFLVEEKASRKFKISTNLQSCANSALNGKYTVDLQKRSVSDKSGAELFSVSESSNKAFLQFLTDICSISGTSTLIQKDANPSFFAFHITSLAELQQSLSEDQKAELYNVFNAVYDKFVSNVLKRYSADEVSGQVLFLNSQTSIKATLTPERMLAKHRNLERILQQTDTGAVPTVADPTPQDTTNIIFGAVVIVFTIVIIWVSIEMFNIDVQKDSVVYAKFLAGDYFRR